MTTKDCGFFGEQILTAPGSSSIYRVPPSILGIGFTLQALASPDEGYIMASTSPHELIEAGQGLFKKWEKGNIASTGAEVIAQDTGWGISAFYVVSVAGNVKVHWASKVATK